MEQPEKRRFAVTWDDLETSAHVPVDQLVEMQDVAVHEPIVTPEELDRRSAIGTVVGDFRLNP